MKYKNIILSCMGVVVLGVGGGYIMQRQHHATSSVSSTSSSRASESSQKVDLPDTAKADNATLILVNKQHVLDHELDFEKSEMNGIQYSQEIDGPLRKFLNDAKKAGHPATLVSGYRSKKYQEQVLNENVQQNINNGMTESEAKKATHAVIQTPGASEHQTGLAVDVMTDEYWKQYHQLESDSDKTEGQKWLIKHAPDYGFILRYPKSEAAKKSTGIDYESWHFRYVGVENAKYMTKHKLTLEEYDDLIQGQSTK